jgi:hypothetical protein
VNVCPFATAALTISLVVVVSYADLKMVIAGDNESPSWKELLNDPTFVAAIKGTNWPSLKRNKGQGNSPLYVIGPKWHPKRSITASAACPQS